MRRFVSLSVVLAAVAAVFVLPGTSHAVGGNFSCRAAIARVTGEGPLAGIVDSEEVVANSQEDPCANDVAGVTTVNLPAGLGGTTAVESRTTHDRFRSAGARAAADNTVLTLPGAPVIRASVLTSNASAQCTGDKRNPVTLAGSSTVLGLTVGGTSVEPGAGHQHINLGPAGTLHLNHQETETTATGGRLVQRALFLDTPIADVVVAEAVADYEGNPCQAVATKS